MEAASRYTLCALSALCTMAQFSWCCYLAVCERRPRLSCPARTHSNDPNDPATSAATSKLDRPRPLTRLAACLHAASLTSATASMTLILLADDIKNATLCSVAGISLVASCIFCSLALCGHAVVTLLWRGSPHSPRTLSGRDLSLTTPTWSVHVYLCCTLTAILLSLAAASLPLMDGVPAGSRCLPLTTYREKGAEYTVLDLGIVFVACAVACVACLVAMVTRVRGRHDHRYLHYESRDLACQIAGVACWIPGLCILIPEYLDTRHTARNTAYFLLGADGSRIRLALSYLLIVYSLAHLIINATLTLYYRLRSPAHFYGQSACSNTRTDADGHSTCSTKKRGQSSVGMEMSASSSSSSTSSSSAPVDSPHCSVTSDKDHVITRFDLGRPPNDFSTAKQIGPLAQIQDTKSIRKYVVTWSRNMSSGGSDVCSKDPGTPCTGQLTVYPPCTRHVWSTHSNAVKRLGAYDPKETRIIRHLWSTERNNLAHTLASLTNAVISPYSSTICTVYYPCGSLRSYLKQRTDARHTLATPPRSVNARHIADDLLTSLMYVHRRHLVHNSLTALAVYVELSAKTNGVRCLLGDFESAYDVTPTPASTHATRNQHVYSLTNKTQPQTNQLNSQDRFAPDMRSLALVLLEVILSLDSGQDENERDVQEIEEKNVSSDHYDSYDLKMAVVTPLPDFKRLSSSEQILNSILRDIRGTSTVDKLGRNTEEYCNATDVDGDLCKPRPLYVANTRHTDHRRADTLPASTDSRHMREIRGVANQSQLSVDNYDTLPKKHGIPASNASSTDDFATIYEDSHPPGHASLATLRRRARMKNARLRMSDKAKSRLAAARRGYVPGSAGISVPGWGLSVPGSNPAPGSECYSDTQIYADASSIYGTRTAFSDSGMDSSYHFITGNDGTHAADARHNDTRHTDASHADSRHTTPDDYYAPLSVGPPGYELPYAVGGAYDGHMDNGYAQMGGAYTGGDYEQIDSSTYGGGSVGGAYGCSSDTYTPSLPRLGVAMASIHRKREHGYSSVNNQNNTAPTPTLNAASYAKHYSTNSVDETSSMGSLDVSAYQLCSSRHAAGPKHSRTPLIGVGRSQLSYYRWLARNLTPPSNASSFSLDHAQPALDHAHSSSLDHAHQSLDHPPSALEHALLSPEANLTNTIARYNETPSSLYSPGLRKILELFNSCWFDRCPPNAHDLLHRLRNS